MSVSPEPRSSIKFAIQIVLTVEFLQKSKAIKTSMDTEEMAKQFLSTHTDMPVNIGQRVSPSLLSVLMQFASNQIDESYFCSNNNSFTEHYGYAHQINYGYIQSCTEIIRPPKLRDAVILT